MLRLQFSEFSTELSLDVTQVESARVGKVCENHIEKSQNYLKNSVRIIGKVAPDAKMQFNKGCLDWN